jgi:hypothetical protein
MKISSVDGGAAVRLLLCSSLSLTAACAGPAPGAQVGEASQAITQCVTIQRGVLGDIADSFIDANAPTTNYDTEPATRVSLYEEALFAVDLSSIPSGATITSASLSLYVEGTTDKNPVNFHAATAPWIEDAVTYQSFDQSFAAAISGSLTATKDGYKSVDLTALTQAWVSGQAPNDGVLAATVPQTKAGAVLFASSESDPDSRPSFSVCYQTAADKCAGVTCAPIDACHTAGTCVPATGICAPGALVLTTLSGNTTVGNAASAAALACTGTVTGTLTVAADASLPTLSLPYLQSVGGLSVTAGSLASTISLPGLTSSSGNVAVEQNAALTTLDLHALASTYTITIASDPNLQSLDLTSLESVTLDLNVVGTNLVTLGPSGLGNLETVGRTLQVVQNPNLTSLGPQSLVHLVSVGGPSTGGTFNFQSNPLVTAVDTGTAVLNGFWLSENPALTSFRLGKLPANVVYANIVDSPLLTDIGATGLSPIQNVAIDMILTNTALASFGPSGLGNLVSVGRSLEVVQNPNLTSLGPTSLVQLASVGGPSLGGTFNFQSNPLITAVDTGSAVLNGFWLSGNPALTSFRLGKLPANVVYANIVDSPLLTDIGATGLSPIQNVAIDMILTNTALASFGPSGLGNLVSVGRSLEVVQNPNLTSLGPTSLVQLASVGGPSLGGTFNFQSNPLVTTVDTGNAVLNGFWLSENPALTSFRLGNLPANVVYANIVDSPLLTDIGATGLSPIQNVEIDMILTNTALASFGPSGLSNLETVGRAFEVVQNPNLTSLGPTSLVQLTAVGGPSLGGTFNFQSNPLVSAIDAGNAVLNGFWLAANPALTSFRLGNLPANVVYANVVDSPLLTDLGATGLSPIQNVEIDMIVSNTGLSGLGPSGLGNLVSVGRTFQVTQNPSLTSLGPTGLSQLASVGSVAYGGGSLTLQGDPRIPTANLSALTSVAGNLVIDGDTALGQLLLGSLTHVGGNLQITNDPALPTCFAGLLGQLIGFGGTVNTSGDGPTCP